MLAKKFVSATSEYSTFINHVPAPYLRRMFSLPKPIAKAQVEICGLGFYRLFINGKEITKGLLAPYVSNPDHLLYYDRYDLEKFLCTGDNCLGIILGNGFLNSIGGTIWDFDKAVFRAAPKVAFCVRITYADGSEEFLEADDHVKTHPSPILFDDLRCGEIYDARREIPGWNLADFDDATWSSAIPAATPQGELRLCTAENIVQLKSLPPISVRPAKISALEPASLNPIRRSIPMEEADKIGFLYDFGENLAGIVCMRIRGQRGQRISIQTGELLDDAGDLNQSGMRFQPEAYQHRMIYTCSGEGEEIYRASFTYFGMRYCLISGISREQATPDLLTFEVMSSDLRKIGDFSCSDPIVNGLMSASWNSDISNFYYFPTDNPHREKNGWTGDAAVSAEQMFLWFSVENSLGVWMENIRKAQLPTGELPGIVPTGGWGYSRKEGVSYNGPGWDMVIVELPYYAWKFHGHKQLILDNASMIFRYLTYLASRRDQRGLLDIGLFDYVPIKYKQPRVPTVVSDTLISMNICQKSATLFSVIGNEEGVITAKKLHRELCAAARAALLESDGITVMGSCQSAQSLGIAYGLFEPEEISPAMDVLLHYIRKSDDHLDTGILGERVIFNVLAENGQTELAYHMITRPDYPSFGHWILKEDCTSMFESFKQPKELLGRPGSRNHHWHGHISGWFFKYLAGIRLNPYDRDPKEMEIAPCFLSDLKFVKGSHELPSGTVLAEWQRTDDGIALGVTLPEGCYGTLRLPEGWRFRDDPASSTKPLSTGTTQYFACSV